MTKTTGAVWILWLAGLWLKWTGQAWENEVMIWVGTILGLGISAWFAYDIILTLLRIIQRRREWKMNKVFGGE